MSKVLPDLRKSLIISMRHYQFRELMGSNCIANKIRYFSLVSEVF